MSSTKWISGTFTSGPTGPTGSVGATGSVGTSGTQEYESKNFLLEKIMNQYDISKEDLKSLAKVKAKIRNFNIDEILHRF